MVIKFRKSSLLNKKRQQTRRLMSEETLDDNGALIATPRRPLRWLSHQPRVSKSHVHAATKSRRLKPCRFTFVHNLKKQTMLRGYSFATGSVRQCVILYSVRF